METINVMNRIDKLFQQKKENILSVFFTAGFPTLHDTVEIAKQLQSAGVDMIEIGIPFSDPIADGPVIQQSGKQAIDNGMTVTLLLEQVKEIRKTVSVPIILMGYLNPVMQYGMDRFFSDAVAAGVDGLILPDMPFEEFESHYKQEMDRLDLRNIFLISPTTSDDRIERIDQASRGFIYAVSSSSTTGSKNEFDENQIRYFKRLKDKQLKNPFLIGFGISNKETFSAACQNGAGAIVGSAFIKVLSASKSIPNDILTFIKTLNSDIK